MEDLIIQGLANCFTKQDAPIVIFCDWDDVKNIEKDIAQKTKIGGYYPHNNPQFPNLNVMTFSIYGNDFFFVDKMQMIEFLEIVKQKMP
ncbi:hypothetical protein [Flavobacterium sp. GNP002]